MKAHPKVRLYVAAVLLFPLFGEAGLQTRLHAQNLTPERQGRLFPPENLGLLEAPDREAWQ